MAEPGAAEITPRPDSGRVFTRGRRVRLADVDPRGRCRLDALVRQLQDIARDDSADSNLTNPMNWIVRRTMVEVRSAPVFQEWIELSTWCSGYGSRWAERRTSVRGGRGAEVEAVTIWVHIDTESLRPTRLADDFFEIWGESAGSRRVSARTTLPAAWPDNANDYPWPLRFTDIDLLGHVNNAAQWAPVEQALHLSGWTSGPIRAELEHGAGIEADSEVRLRWTPAEGGVDTWLTTNGAASSVARVRPLSNAS
ncbi:MAG: thioesterase [Acidimicrobiaceae bacterium]|nr:hypothetical protein [Acidimicrobiia bacterium]MCY4494354.1 thioesterase [Acidimicrobiaceae bacterium]